MKEKTENQGGVRPARRVGSANGAVKRLNVVLLKPSKYDDDGYVIHHFRGVLPSNTLACLYALTEDVKNRRVLGDEVEIRALILDETVQKINVRKIIRMGRKKGARTVVGLVGVQTNQFPRAADLATQFVEGGLDVIIGGFHVSGMLATFDKVPGDLQSLMDRGVCLVAGEVEGRWGGILKDVINSSLKPLYNFLGDPPDLRYQPVSVVNRDYLKHFVFPNFGTIDCGRGCPFNCSFCTIINVHGRKVRCRDADVITRAIRENYRRGISFYFFTDDNFARNRNWEKIFDRLIHLRSAEGIDVEFMIQADVLSYKIEGFIEKARAAGCTNVFIGMESVNPENLKAAGKRQNVVEDFTNLISAWHKAGVSTHVGYIIGFPGDTEESVERDIRTLMNEIKVELASFFMLTPLPGSLDHRRMVSQGLPMDPDYNRYDSFHETTDHPNMGNGRWERAYHGAWETFYGFDNMKAILSRSCNPRRYWDTLWKFFWYKGSATVEGSHPMLTGLFRLKGRKARRPGYSIEPLPAYLRMRAGEILREIRGLIGVWCEVQELWLQTRPQTAFETRFIKEWKQLREAIVGRLTILEWRSPYLWFRPLLSRVYRRLNVFSLRDVRSRRELNLFWKNLVESLSTGKVYRIRPVKTIVNALRDMRISFQFLRSVLGGSRNKYLANQAGVSMVSSSTRKTVIALGLPQRFEGLKRSIESFLVDLGVDIVSYEGASRDLSAISDSIVTAPEGSVAIVRNYLEGLRGRADFILLPFTKGLECFHENFTSGLMGIANDVRERLSMLPRVIYFPILATESGAVEESLVRLGLCFTDDRASVVAASEKAASYLTA